MSSQSKLLSVRVAPAANMVAPCGRERSLMSLVKKLVRDEQGGEVLEYALVAGLIVVLSIALIGAVGTKVLGRWTSLNNSM